MKTKLNIIRILLAGMLFLTVSCWDGFNDTLMGNDNVDPAEVVLTNVTFDAALNMTVSWTEPTMQNYSGVYITIVHNNVTLTHDLIDAPAASSTPYPVESSKEYAITVKARYSSGFESKGQTFTVTATAVTGWGFIYTVAALKNVVTSNNYILLKDLDLSSEASWDPIGDSSTPFTGKFDGNGHTIRNMRITGNSENAGLFCTVSNAAGIKNLNLTGVYIDSTYPSSGGLAGIVSGGVITNCHVSGTIKSNDANTGGLIGFIQNSGTISNSSFHGNVNGVSNTGGLIGSVFQSSSSYTIEISQCYAEATVTGSGSNIGGFAGEIYKNSNTALTLNNCYALCTVTAPGCTSVGGFAGKVYSASSNLLTIQNCYAVGTVTGAGNVGGFAGTTEGPSDNPVTITECYSTGNVTGTGTNTGGFVGNTQYAVITDCYCTGTVQGNTNVGGFIGFFDRGNINTCYTACEVNGSSTVGGFRGDGSRTPTNCYFMDSSYSNGTGMTYLDETARYILSSYSGFNPSAPGTIIWEINSSINGGLPYLKDLVP